MQKFPRVSALIMVTAFVAAVAVSREMNRMRPEFYKNKERETRKYFPCLGIDKFWADVSWLSTINALGRARKQMDPVMVRYFRGRFNRITNLDPDFMPVYKIGVSFIAYENLDEALKLMDKAQKYANKQDWHVPYQAAHWVLQIRANDRKAGKEEKRKAYELAIDYINKAIAAGGVPWYVENMLLHTMAKKDGVYGKDLPELRAWARYYRKRMAKAREAMSRSVDPDGRSPKGMETMSVEMDFASDPVVVRLRKRIMERCLELMRKLIAREAKGKGKRQVLRDQAEVRKIFKSVNPSGHYAPRSLVAYGPGELFDRTTGDALVPYGIDLYDYEVNGRIVNIGSDTRYNTLTGKPVAGTFEELRKMLAGRPITRLKAHMPKAGK